MSIDQVETDWTRARLQTLIKPHGSLRLCQPAVCDPESEAGEVTSVVGNVLSGSCTDDPFNFYLTCDEGAEETSWSFKWNLSLQFIYPLNLGVDEAVIYLLKRAYSCLYINSWLCESEIDRSAQISCVCEVLTSFVTGSNNNTEPVHGFW